MHYQKCPEQAGALSCGYKVHKGEVGSSGNGRRDSSVGKMKTVFHDQTQLIQAYYAGPLFPMAPRDGEQEENMADHPEATAAGPQKTRNKLFYAAIREYHR